MNKIICYTGVVDTETFRSVKAEIDFGNPGKQTGIVNRKTYSESEIRKGFEQLKRWVSTGAFKAIVLANFFTALKRFDSNGHILEWVSEHSEEPDFPLLIVLDQEDMKGLPLKVSSVETAEELRTLV